MFLVPRIIVIDDDPAHLRGLVDGLHKYGTSCLPIHFTGDSSGIRKCPDVRLIFADLHLNEGGPGGEYERHFSTIGGLIEETFGPLGPYVLILWTRYADQAKGLEDFLESRLANVSKPLAVVPLDKTTHLDSVSGAVKDPAALVNAIDAIILSQPQLAALLRWEERVLYAAADTVGAILRMTGAAKNSGERAQELSRLLARLATEAVGEGHVDRDRFGAVTEALLPILGDRVTFMQPTKGDIEVWNRAFNTGDANSAVSVDEAAQLNRMLHVDEVSETMASDRGSIVALPGDELGEAFKRRFGLDESVAAAQEFSCRSFDAKSDQYRWMVVQMQAACDSAQRQPGPLPYLLALEMPQAAASRDRPPAALWRSPPLYLGKAARALHVNCRFPFLLAPDAAANLKASYRLREQLISGLAYTAHVYGARPGPIVFSAKSAKK